jgi:hypothetical protein
VKLGTSKIAWSGSFWLCRSVVGDQKRSDNNQRIWKTAEMSRLAEAMRLGGLRQAVERDPGWAHGARPDQLDDTFERRAVIDAEATEVGTQVLPKGSDKS